MTHQAEAINQMKEVLERAAIRDANLYRGFRMAAVIGLFGPEQLEDPSVNDEHKEWVRVHLADLRAWLHADLQALVDNRIPRDDLWEDIARALDPDRVEERSL